MIWLLEQKNKTKCKRFGLWIIRKVIAFLQPYFFYTKRCGPVGDQTKRNYAPGHFCQHENTIFGLGNPEIPSRAIAYFLRIVERLAGRIFFWQVFVFKIRVGDFGIPSSAIAFFLGTVNAQRMKIFLASVYLRRIKNRVFGQL